MLANSAMLLRCCLGLILGSSLAACSMAPPPPEATASFATEPALEPAMVQLISADASWLGSNKLAHAPEKESSPQSAATCPEGKIADRGTRQLRLPSTLVTVLVSYEARPWAFVRYDLDATGTPVNLKIEKSAGLKSFDQAALDTVRSWRFELKDGLSGAKACVADVAIT
jgi:TonB family protein